MIRWLSRTLLLFALTASLPTPIAEGQRPLLVIWNVGQGLWATIMTERTCLHFDMGGERRPTEVASLCRSRPNLVFFSHGDQDHISFLTWARRHLPHLCIAKRPLGALSARKAKQLAAAPDCSASEIEKTGVIELTNWVDSPRPKKSSPSSNELSRVYIYQTVDGGVLLPGDSEKSAEKIWSKKLWRGEIVKWLVLGHHGSRTSTSSELLNRLPQLEMGFASARKKKYGHPHPEVLGRLQNQGVSVLSTETLGTLAIEL
jgi:competence protein ComEC